MEWLSKTAIFSAILLVLSFVIKAIFGEMSKDFYTYLKRVFKKKEDYLYEWNPATRFHNSNDNIQDIENYPKDVNFNFITGTIDKDKQYIQGYECFVMQLTKLINTEKDKYKIYSSKYGISYFYQNVENQEEFEKYCLANAEDIMIFFSDWIKEIHFIKKYRKKNFLQIGVGLKGMNEIVKIDIYLLDKKE